ncbi:unnamed protein product [Cuscuta epithymum]|uniref:DUF7890 domain-containing protein n=1 Tax=Cuscuta epithymum TaxID=186058 RepID=A0AAV0D168_9ASTE|nr:unnamed protein product [Cuscuta epithymum]
MLMRSLNPFLRKTSPQECDKARKPKAVQTTVHVYREGLDTTKKPPSHNKIKKKVRFDLGQQGGEESEEESIKKKNSGGVKVKILLTKEEAARLLSRCNDGGVLTFTDLGLDVIDSIPSNRVAMIS